MYIFVGDIPKSVLAVLKTIQDKNLYNSWISLSDKELNTLIKFYGDYWYKKFFNTYHMNYIINMAKELPNYKKELIKKFGQKWYDIHIKDHKLIERKLFYSYANRIKAENERKMRKRERLTIGDPDMELNYSTKEQKNISSIKNELNKNLEIASRTFASNIDDYKQKGGNTLSKLDDDDDEIEDIPDQKLEQGEFLEEFIDEEDLDEIEKMFKHQDVIPDEKAQETSKLIQKALDDDKIFKKESKKMVKFDDDKDDLLFDEQLKNNFEKKYVTNQFIFKDDTIENMKKKICVSILNNDKFGKINYIIPSRQYLWCEYFYDNKVEKVMVGQKWIRRSELLQIDVEPNTNFRFYEELRGNLKFLGDNIKRYGSKIKREDDDYNILYDYDDYSTNNEIYILDIYNEFGKGYNPTPEILQNIIDVYSKVYFPKIRSDEIKNIIDFVNGDSQIEENKMTTVFETITNDLIVENEIVDTVLDVKMGKQDYKKLFKANYITQSVIHVDLVIKKGKLSLFRIFNEFIVNEKYPFIQYQTLDGQIAFKFDEKEIKDYHAKKDRVDLLSKWFENAPYGISFKVKVENSDKFMAIGLNENGRIEYKTQWKEEDMATIDDIKKTYKHVRELIQKLNDEKKNRIKFEIPEDPQYRYAFINSIQKFVLPNDLKINHNDLSEFSRYFYPYVALVIEPRKRQSKTLKNQELSKYGTYLRYKRISNYENQQRIEQRILYFMRNYEYTDQSLANEISKQFNITLEKAYQEIDLVRRKYPNIKKSRKVLKKLESIPKNKPPGIGIDIQGKSNDKYKIRISGARNKEQLERMLTFMNVLIYLYTETYLMKKPERQKLKDKLKKLTHIARRRHRVAEIVDHDSGDSNVKAITKRDSKRIGFKPEKGQNQWTRSCQNSGDNKRRRPQQYTKIDDMLKDGYKLNKKTGFYEKNVRIKDKGKQKSSTIRTVKLEDIDNTGKTTGRSIYYACDPKENGEHFYVGFLSKGNNPFGFCMPCCFKKDQLFSKNKNKQEYFLECIGKKETKKDQVKKEKEPVILGDQLYILQDTHKIQEGRLAFLPKDLDFFFNYKLNKTKEIKQNYLTTAKNGYYFKMGSKQDDFPFLNAISIVLNMSVDEIKRKIVKALENDKSDLMFTYLNNGEVRERFNTRKNFIDFIQNNHFLGYELMNNIISIPNVLTKDGLNILVFKEVVKKIKKAFEKEKTIEDFVMLCQNYEENYNITSPIRKNIILLQEFNNFNPIIMVTKEDENTKDINIKKMFIYQNTKLNVINNLVDFYNRNCTGSFIEQMKNTKTNPIAKVTYGILQNLQDTGYNPKYQIIDARNKCKYIITNNSTIIPVTPSGSILNLMIVKHIDPQLIDAKKMFQQLNKLNDLVQQKLNISPIGVYYEESESSNDTYMVTALMNNSKDIVPTLPTKIKNSWLSSNKLVKQNEPLFDKIDKEIQKGSTNVQDKRNIEMGDYKYRIESYQLFRFNLSDYLNKSQNEAIYKKIDKIIQQNGTTHANKRREIRKILYKISDRDLSDMYERLVQQTGGKFINIISKYPDTINYNIKNTRDVCDIHEDKDKCNNNIHCKWRNDSCNFATTKELLIEFINRASEELAEGKLKSDEILQKEDYFVSDIVDMNSFTEREGQKIIKSTNTTLKKMLEEIFGEENVPQIGKRRGMKLEEDDYIALNNDNPIRDMRETWTQNLMTNNLTIFRAYSNGFYWVKHPFYDVASRNLGFYHPIQTDLSNYFRSLIADWLLDKDHSKEIKERLNEYINLSKKENSLRNYVLKLTSDIFTTSNCLVELYVLSRIQQIPIYVYDDSNRILHIFDNGHVFKKNDNIKDTKFKKYHSKEIKKNSIHIRFSFLRNKEIPDEIEVIYLK